MQLKILEMTKRYIWKVINLEIFVRLNPGTLEMKNKRKFNDLLFPN